MILGRVGVVGPTEVGFDRYFAVTQRTLPWKMICARPYCVAPVMDSLVPSGTSVITLVPEEVTQIFNSAMATRVPITRGSVYMELARYCMLDQPRVRPWYTSAKPRAVFPVMVTGVPPLITVITGYDSPGPVRRFSAVVVILTLPAPIWLGPGSEEPAVRYGLAT